MDVSKMIADLQAEREALTAAMSVLERIAQSRGRRRGRPPAWLAGVSKKSPDAGAAAGEDRPKRVMSAATKKKMAVAQRKRWAAAKKAAESQA
jgi:hypothetical protein